MVYGASFPFKFISSEMKIRSCRDFVSLTPSRVKTNFDFGASSQTGRWKSWGAITGGRNRYSSDLVRGAHAIGSKNKTEEAFHVTNLEENSCETENI